MLSLPDRYIQGSATAWCFLLMAVLQVTSKKQQVKSVDLATKLMAVNGHEGSGKLVVSRNAIETLTSSIVDIVLSELRAESRTKLHAFSLCGITSAGASCANKENCKYSICIIIIVCTLCTHG